MNIKKSILLRVRLAFLAAVAFASVIAYQIVKVQFVEGDQWRQMAEDIGLDYRKIKATRGSIYASGNDLLATSLPFYKVAFDPSLVSEREFRSGIDSLSRLISAFFKDQTPAYYKKKIQKARASGRQYLVINKQLIDYQEKEAMSQWPIFRKGWLRGGIIFHKVYERHRPFRQLAQRTIGYINEDHVGAGIEKSFDHYLAGSDGEGLFRKVSGGNWKPVQAASDIKPRDGYDVYTTIDINLQDVAQNALLRALERYEAAYGCVVLMEVKTGEIKAISNLTRQQNGTYAEVYNYAVQGLNDPGSTFKLASMIALLEEGKTDLTDTVDTGEGTIQFYNRTMKDEKRGGYGKITVREVFERSSNVGIMKLVDEYFGEDPQQFIDLIKKTGLGNKLDFQMIGEGAPMIKDTDDETWSGVSLPWMSIGYEMHLTPLQTLSLYNAVANDGRMIQPIIVKSIRQADRPVKVFKTRTLTKRIASKNTLNRLKDMLKGVVEHGTASNIRNSFYKIAGKTGTAQKLVEGRYMTQRYYASFAGYFPADEPRYSAIVVIDSPKGWNRFGGDVSAPVFKEIADMIYAQDLNIHEAFEPERLAEEGTFPWIRAGYYDELKALCDALEIDNRLEEEDVKWVRTKIDHNTIVWKRNHSPAGLVPNVQGMTLRDAVYLLENKGLKVSITGTGRVKRQSIRPGVKINKGSMITIELG